MTDLFGRPSSYYSLTVGWLPEEFCDEISPPSLPTPNDFVRLESGKAFLAARDNAGALDEFDFAPIEIGDGHTTKFYRFDVWPMAVIRISEDGSWEVSYQPPADINVITFLRPSGEWENFDDLRDVAETLAWEARDNGLSFPFEAKIAYRRDYDPVRMRFDMASGSFEAIQ